MPCFSPEIVTGHEPFPIHFFQSQRPSNQQPPMKKIIKVNSHYMTPWMKAYYYELLKDSFEFIESRTDPEYVLVGTNQTCYVRGEDHINHRYLNDVPASAIRIYLQHEAVGVDMTLFDYAVLFTDDMKLDDRVFFANFFSSGYFHQLGNNIFERLDAGKPNAETLLTGKSVFCNFVYSHRGVLEREQIFHKLSEHRFVESYGKLLNNTNPEEKAGAASHYHHNWFEEGIDLKRASKFSIAAENALHPMGYYVTEKIVTAMLANTIPVYWGNPNVGKLFNDRAFINCHDYESFDAVRERVAEIDGDDRQWCDMMSEPWMTPDQYLEASGNQQRLKEFLTGIFEQPLESARRRARGFWAGRYENAQKRLLRDAGKFRDMNRIDIPALQEKFTQRLIPEPTTAQTNSLISDVRVLKKRLDKELWEKFLELESKHARRFFNLAANSGARRRYALTLAIAYYDGDGKLGVTRNRSFAVRWLRDLVEGGLLESPTCPAKAFLYWGLIHMEGEAPMVDRNPARALECFAKIAECEPPEIRTRALFNQALLRFREGDIPRTSEAIIRLLQNRSVGKLQADLLIDFLSHPTHLTLEQRKFLRKTLACDRINQRGSWKKLRAGKLPWRMRWKIKKFAAVLEKEGFFCGRKATNPGATGNEA
jgi:hypothetical protein